MSIKISNLKNYFFNIILIWLVFLLYRKVPYYSSFLRQDTQTTIFYLALAYSILGFFYYFFVSNNRTHETKGAIIFNTLKRFFKDSYSYLKSIKKEIKNPIPKLEKREKVMILFVLVKIFFIPIMLNFFFQNFEIFKNQILNISNPLAILTINGFNLILFPFLLTSIFMIDTLWFSFGYVFEAGFFGNKIISVEPTLFGWLVALACYPPFNGIITQYTNWYANDYVLFPNEIITLVIRIMIVLLLLLYLGATLALGAKSSNLTNRGVVSRGPYAMIRHPAYLGKNLAWWLTIIPVISWPAVLSMAAWSFIYHLRSITEEKHLSQDPNYIEYCKKVRYRYIPGVY